MPVLMTHQSNTGITTGHQSSQSIFTTKKESTVVAKNVFRALRRTEQPLGQGERHVKFVF
jgi:hypothetical protein